MSAPIATVAVGPHLFWITSRAAGTAALALSSLAVCAGLSVGTRGRLLRGRGGELKALHEALSLATLAAIAVHGAALLGDSWLHPSPLEISVPFAAAYRPFWTGLGIVAGWGLAVLGLSYYARRHIGQARWRSLHRFTALFWALGIVHTLGAGTDAAQPWFLILLAVPALPAAALLAARLSRARAQGYTVSPESSSRIDMATAGQASAASSSSSSGPLPITTAVLVEAEHLGGDLDAVAVGAALVGVDHGSVLMLLPCPRERGGVPVSISFFSRASIERGPADGEAGTGVPSRREDRFEVASAGSP